MKTISRFFPRSTATIVHQDGANLGTSEGVKIILHTRENDRDPCCAEVICGDLHAEIGLWFKGKRLIDYDGIFSLPREVGEILKDSGYIVPKD